MPPAIQLQLQTITDNIKVLNSNHQVLHDRWETSTSQFKASWAQISMIYQLRLKPLIITFHWTVQSPWQAWKNRCTKQPLLSLRNTQKTVLCQRFSTSVPWAHRCAARIFKTCSTWVFSQGHWPLFPETVKQKMTTANVITVIWCEWIKLIPIFVRSANI